MVQIYFFKKPLLTSLEQADLTRERGYATVTAAAAVTVLRHSRTHAGFDAPLSFVGPLFFFAFICTKRNSFSQMHFGRRRIGSIADRRK